MPNKKNIETVSFLTEKIEACAGLVLFDYRGTTMTQLTALRQELCSGPDAHETCEDW